MTDNSTMPQAGPPEPFDQIRERYQQRLALYDQRLRKERYHTLILQASLVAILLAISALAFAMKTADDSALATVIALLSAVALAILGYLVGYKPQIRWGQYLEARRDLSRRMLEMDILLQNSPNVPAERVLEISHDVSFFLERPFGLIETQPENHVAQTPAGV